MLAQPKKGRGQSLALSRHLSVSTTMVSLVLKGKLEFSVEQGLKLAEFCHLTTQESQFLVELILFARAGDLPTKKYFKNRIEQLQVQVSDLKVRLPRSPELTRDEQAQFYSDWAYAAVHLATAISEFNSTEAIAAYLKLDRLRAEEIINFLVETGFIDSRSGRLKMGTQSTSVTKESPFLRNHQRNWRLKAVSDLSSTSSSENLNYSLAVCLNRDDFRKIRELLVECLNKAQTIHKPSPSEQIAYLNIDWALI
jgi:uncharacterized protein (TIGR02147 family)